MKNLQKDTEVCLRQILGGVHVPSPNRTKIKSGAVVYRISGNGGDLNYNEETNKVFIRAHANASHKDFIEVTPETFDTFKTPGVYVGLWQVVLLYRGRERTRKELQAALIQRGHAVEVRIGGGDYYPASVAVEQLSKSAKPGDKFDAKMLAGEMIALGEALAPIQKTLDEVSLRLRALGIALTINLKE